MGVAPLAPCAPRAFAEQLASVPCFLSKTWLRDGAVHGGFYLFAADAQASTSTARCSPACAVPRPDRLRYTVDTEVGALTGCL